MKYPNVKTKAKKSTHPGVILDKKYTSFFLNKYRTDSNMGGTDKRHTKHTTKYKTPIAIDPGLILRPKTQPIAANIIVTRTGYLSETASISNIIISFIS
ncbi:MAG TPA: hypothetical protein DIW47_08880 [Bacteroidetes bacterium]|nr:hypothetical protein [Bacteroidota bacterium]